MKKVIIASLLIVLLAIVLVPNVGICGKGKKSQKVFDCGEMTVYHNRDKEDGFLFSEKVTSSVAVDFKEKVDVITIDETVNETTTTTDWTPVSNPRCNNYKRHDTAIHTTKYRAQRNKTVKMPVHGYAFPGGTITSESLLSAVVKSNLPFIPAAALLRPANVTQNSGGATAYGGAGGAGGEGGGASAASSSSAAASAAAAAAAAADGGGGGHGGKKW